MNDFYKQKNKIIDTLDYAINNPYCDFYRKKYASLDFNPLKIKSYEEFQELPLLEKEEILAIPVDERLFVEKPKVNYYTISSGTTSSSKPMIMAHSFGDPRTVASSYEEKKAMDSGAMKTLVMLPPASGSFGKRLSTRVPRHITIAGDVYNLERSALIAKELNVEAIVTTITIASQLTTYLMKIDYDFTKIKLISLGGELATEKQKKWVQDHFKNAKIIFRYGVSELGNLRGWQCDNLNQNFPPNVFHPSRLFFHEINEEDDHAIIHTDMIRKPFPLIRYKTDDTAEIKDIKCSCGEEKILIMGGRNFNRKLKFYGLTLYSEILENIISNYWDTLLPYFEAHIFEKITENKPIPEIKINLYSNKVIDNKKKEEIFKDINENLYLSATKNAKTLAVEGYIAPIKITYNKPKNHFKNKKIISHLT